MSSWKKASKINQRVHRERHQPESRAHLGLLEKKKDYKQRANDYNKKKAVLKKLRIEALNKNPDEFYFHMINSKLVDGRHTEKVKGDTEDTIEQKKLMENRNLSYVNMKRTLETNKIERLKGELHATELVALARPKHILFNDEGEPEPFNEAAISLPVGNIIAPSNLNSKVVKILKKKREIRYKQLSKRIEREKQLRLIQRKMEIQRALKDKSCSSAPKMVKKGSKTEAPEYVWKYERKR